MKIIINIVMSVIMMLLVSACATKPTHMDLVIRSKSDINLDSDNITSPLMLNFYELDSAEQFSKLDYWTIIDNAKERLGSDLISQTHYAITPNEQQRYKILFDNKAKFLGIVGSFRNLDANSTWRYVINLENKAHNYVELEINGYQIKEVK